MQIKAPIGAVEKWQFRGGLQGWGLGHGLMAQEWLKTVDGFWGKS
jgi:hypothetical protein